MEYYCLENVQKAMQSCKLKGCISQFPRRAVTSPPKRTVHTNCDPIRKSEMPFWR